MVEALTDRIVPSVTYFDYTAGTTVITGYVDYDDAGVNAASSTQTVAATDVDFTFNGVEYTWSVVDSGATVSFAYGRVTGYAFTVTTPPSGGEYLSASFTGGVLSVSHGDPYEPGLTYFPTTHLYNDGPPATLDTSDTDTGSAFSFTLSDGTYADGEFILPSANVVSTGSVSLTGFTLNIDGETFGLADCDSTPTANFSSGVFTGLSYSLTSPGSTGIDSIVASAGVVTTTISTVVDPKPMKFKLADVKLDMAGMTTGMNYNVQVTIYPPVGAGPSVTMTFAVAAGNTTAQIRDAFLKQLTNNGIFIGKADPNAPNVVDVGGIQTKNLQLARIEFTLYTAVNGMNQPIPNLALSGPTFAGSGGMPLPVAKVNGTTITP